MAISEQAAEASRRGGPLLPDDGVPKDDNIQVAGIGSFFTKKLGQKAENEIDDVSANAQPENLNSSPETDPEKPAVNTTEENLSKETLNPQTSRIDDSPTTTEDVNPKPQTSNPKRVTEPEIKFDNYTDPKTDAYKGKDFNFSNIETTEQAKKLINQVSIDYAAKTKVAKGGVVTDKTTREVADMLGIDGDAAKRAIETLPSDVKDLNIRALVMRDMMIKSAEEVDKLARIVAGPSADVSDAQRFAFRQKLTEHASLQASMKGVQTEIARALAGYRIPANATALERSQYIQDILENTGGPRVAEDLAKRWLQTPMKDKGRITIGWAAKTRAAVFEIWINGLLSSLRTQTINLGGNSIFRSWQLPERAVGGLIGSARQLLPNADPDRVAALEFVHQMHGWVETIPDAFRIAAKVFRTDTPQSPTSRVELTRTRAIEVGPDSMQGFGFIRHMTNYFGSFVRLPSRFLMAADEYGKAIGNRMELRAQAARSAQRIKDAGGTKQEAQNAYASVLRGESEVANAEARQFADITTFTKVLDEKGQAFTKLVNKFPGARLILPFIRTPANILKELIKRTPAAPILKEVRQDILAGGAKRDLAYARVAIGTSAMCYGVNLAEQGVITGGGPKDPNMRKIWLMTNQPYSIKINDKWYPYGRLEPIGTLFGMAADYYEFNAWKPTEQTDSEDTSLEIQALAVVLQNAGQKTFLMGLADAARAISDPTRYGESWVQRLTGGLAQPLYSSMLRDVEKAIDPELSEKKVDPTTEMRIKGKTVPGVQAFYRALNEVKSRTPGWNDDLPPRRNFWGEEIKAFDGEWYQAFNAFAPKKVKVDEVVSEILRLKVPIAMPRRAITENGTSVKLTPKQYDKLVVSMNNIKTQNQNTNTEMNMRQYMGWLIKKPRYYGASETDQAKELRNVRNKFLKAAQMKLLKDDIELFERYIVKAAQK